jgi:GT2 family glycosyltransferase
MIDTHPNDRFPAGMNYILLPVHNRRTTTEAFVRALARQTERRFRLVLIDDGSSDGTAAAVLALLADRTSVVRGPGTWWWGGALHHGWLWLLRQQPSDEDVVIICNDDVEIPDDFLASGLASLAQEPDAMFVSLARDTSGKTVQTCFAIDYRRCEVTLAGPGARIDCAPTRGLFIRWRQMRRVGGFHPRLLPHYLADLEWTARAQSRGVPIRTDDRLWLVPNHEKTGAHDLRPLPLARRLRLLLSPKYAGNPLAWSTFIVLRFPPRHWPAALARVALWTAGAVLGR